MDNAKHVLMFGVSPFSKATSKTKTNKKQATTTATKNKKAYSKICDERCFFFVFFFFYLFESETF